MAANYYLKKESEAEQEHYDWKQIISEYMEAPGGGGSITRQVSSTITWGITFTAGVTFEGVNAALGGQYSESKTFSTSYTFNLLAGETARIIYVPKIHFINGWLTKTIEGSPVMGPFPPPPLRMVIDNQWVQIHFPLDGGRFTLEYDKPTFYTDSRFRGTAIRLDKGGHDWGSIPNDEISSLRVPENYTVALFKDTRFKGESIIFGPGDYPYVGDNFNDQTSSINIW
ncbi:MULTISPECIES: hypothetical protein [unclassified Microcoleus]|uniref:hypothetical protein n=1 Tax=unclassified Microcoleus TaxID=2642155 RepID=UPI002FD64540